MPCGTATATKPVSDRVTVTGGYWFNDNLQVWASVAELRRGFAVAMAVAETGFVALAKSFSPHVFLQLI
jgi:hypothetical protein